MRNGGQRDGWLRPGWGWLPALVLPTNLGANGRWLKPTGSIRLSGEGFLEAMQNEDES